MDHSSIELPPDGSICIWDGSATASHVLRPDIAYRLAVFFNSPGVRPALRRLDKRQRLAWEQRRAA